MKTENARALVKAINRHLKKNQVFVGGRQYGVDWPTWNVCYPQLAIAFDSAGHILMGSNDPSRHFMPLFNY